MFFTAAAGNATPPPTPPADAGNANENNDAPPSRDIRVGIPRTASWLNVWYVVSGCCAWCDRNSVCVASHHIRRDGVLRSIVQHISYHVMKGKESKKVSKRAGICMEIAEVGGWACKMTRCSNRVNQEGTEQPIDIIEWRTHHALKRNRPYLDAADDAHRAGSTTPWVRVRGRSEQSRRSPEEQRERSRLVIWCLYSK